MSKLATQRTIVWLCVLVGCALTLPVSAQDIVYTRSAKGEVPRKGTIVAWAGNSLTMEIGGREKSLNSEDIVRFETAWSDQYKQAETIFATRDFRQAIGVYRAALQVEQRGWAQNIILARIVQCSNLLESHASAGVAFSHILSSDSQTRFLHLIPLPWSSSLVDRGTVESAKAWLQSRTPATRLMGASWLLGSEMRDEAQVVLEKLSRDLDPDVAHLAKLQLWRAKVVTAKPNDMARLESQIERMPKVLRAPALLILADIQSRLKMQDQAVLTLMRIPILHPDNLKLSALALQKAAAMMKDSGQTETATRLYREVTTDFVGTRFATEAAAQLQSLSGNQ